MSITTTLIIAIATTGISLAGVMIGLVAWLRTDMKRMEERIREDMRLMENRMEDKLSAFDRRLSALEHSQAKLEGLLEGLREAIVSRAAA